jgi:hypothetical protein
MSVLTDLETKLNGAVVDFQNVVAGIVAEAKTVLEAAPAAPADSTGVDGDVAKVESDEATLDADTATLDSDEKAEEGAEAPAAPADGTTQIPVTDGDAASESAGEDSTDTAEGTEAPEAPAAGASGVAPSNLVV